MAEGALCNGGVPGRMLRGRLPCRLLATALGPASASTPPRVLFNCLPNNIHVAVTTTQLNAAPGTNGTRLLFKLSAGTVGLHGASKTAAKAIPLLLDTLKARLLAVAPVPGALALRVAFRGVNTARPLLVSGLRRLGLRILEVADVTGVPFNGCRPKKARRL